MSTTTTQHKTSAPVESAKEVLYVFQWQQGAVDVLKNISKMGGDEWDDGLAAWLEKRQYQRLPGGVEPMATWESVDEASTTNRFCVIGRYPRYGNAVLVFQIQNIHGLRSWMEKYLGVCQVLPEVVIEQPVSAPHNIVTEYRPRPRW